MMEGSACLLGKTQLGVTASAWKELSVLMWMTVYLLNSWGKGCGISCNRVGEGAFVGEGLSMQEISHLCWTFYLWEIKARPLGQGVSTKDGEKKKRL